MQLPHSRSDMKVKPSKIFNLKRTIHDHPDGKRNWRIHVFTIFLAIGYIIDGVVLVGTLGFWETEVRCFVSFDWDLLNNWIDETQHERR